ncbi:hypothetical protein Tco_1016158 [Tanacetum coccineum]|uniref:Uncharacterized protein n=1 Tax=Tanacetum coccineum TaxID=301880 RepID=A0ABQ5FMV1_9ASTR
MLVTRCRQRLSDLGRNDEDLMFDTGVLNGDEVFQEPMVNTATTTSSIPVSVADPVTTADYTCQLKTKAKEIIFHDQEEQEPASTPIVSPSQLPQAKYKGKAKMVELEKPLKKKDQIAIDEEVARNLEAQLQAELEEEERLSRQKTSKRCLDKEMKRVNTFVDMNTELVKGSKTKAKGSSKRAGEELESDNSKKQRIDEHWFYWL